MKLYQCKVTTVFYWFYFIRTFVNPNSYYFHIFVFYCFSTNMTVHHVFHIVYTSLSSNPLYSTTNIHNRCYFTQTSLSAHAYKLVSYKLIVLVYRIYTSSWWDKVGRGRGRCCFLSWYVFMFFLLTHG